VFSLARELGMTVDRLMREMTSDELVYWMAYSALEKEDTETRHDKAAVTEQVRGSRGRR